MRVRKEVVREGTYAYRDKAGKLQSVTATPELIKYWGDSGNAMRQAGHRIPVPIEHDTTAHPLTPAEKLLNNAGEVESYEFGHVEENGVKKQALFSWNEIHDERVKGKITDGTIKWTSPAFDSFTDATGKRWEGVITHLALTSRPAFTEQEPFQAQFSLTPLVPTLANLPNGVCLSRAGLVREATPGTFQPLYPVAFSLWAGAKFAFDEEGGEKKPPKKDKGDGEKAPPKKGAAPGAEGEEEEGEESPFGGDEEGGMASKPKFDPMTGQPIKESLVDPDGDIDVWCVLAYLAEMALDVDLGDEEITAENGPEKLLEIFKEALRKKLGEDAGMGAQPPGAPPVPAGKPASNPIIQEQQPLYMSLNTMTAEEANKIPDPTMRKIALELVESRRQNESLRQKAFKDKMAERTKRVTNISRFLPDDKREPILAGIAGAKFSLADDGTVNDEAEALLLLGEAIIGTMPALLKGGTFSIEEQPSETKGGTPPGRMEEVEKEFRRNAGVPQRV